MRAALLPTLAHTALKGNYDWLLYGDDVGGGRVIGRSLA
jgi:hypothetical protein